MNNVNDLMQIDFGYIFVGLLLLGVVLKFIYELLDFFIAKTGIEFRWKREQKEDRNTLRVLETKVKEIEANHKNDIDEILESNKRVEDDLKFVSATIKRMSTMCPTLELIHQNEENISKAMIELMYSTINERCHKYIEDGYIPEDEVIALNDMLEKYTLIGGNHGLENKVRYCIENLPLHPSKYPSEK